VHIFTPNNEATLDPRGVVLPDYFSGTPGVMLAIPVGPETTYTEVLDGLVKEISDLYDLIDGYFTPTGDNNSILSDEEIVAERWEDVWAAVGYMKGHYDAKRDPADNNLVLPFFTEDNPDWTENDECPFAIFAIEIND